MASASRIFRTKGGDGRGYEREVGVLLARRLFGVCLVIGAGLLLALLREYFLVRSGPTLASVQVGMILIMALGMVLIRIGRLRSVLALRCLEVIVFFGTPLFLGTRYFLEMQSRPQELEALRAAEGLHELTTACLVLAVVYGLVIPTNWRRAALVVFPVLLVPIVVPVHLARSVENEVLNDLVNREMISGSVLVLVIGALIALYGSHVLSTLRREVFEARRLGQYELQEQIGSGGMGEVWRAKHRLLSRPAAIKLITPHSTRSHLEGEEVLRTRFEREAQITASLESPHTVQVYDFGTTPDGTFYLVMELLRGMTLDRFVRQHGPMLPERVVRILRQVCYSLAEAHARGLIHRDIKPANLHVGRVGLTWDFVKVLDFGLALPSRAAEDARLTHIGTIGTPAFIPPEVVEGKTEIDHRADLYSLGCVAYWLLTGQFVFAADNPVQMASDHLSATPVPPGQRVGKEFPPELEKIVMDCLAKNPDDRPADAAAVIDRLEAIPLASRWTQSRARAFWEQIEGDADK
ncbi:MAG: serine/threonine protein kinase [Planctomycetes bacterium]|nr:serine/threonine protein kinase [Planctomycetota bacterium]